MNPNFLEFEQPIAELEAKIEELRLVGSGSDVNISEEIGKLQEKSITLTENIFGNLSPWQISQLARHPSAPTPWITSSACSAASTSCTGTGRFPTIRRSSAASPAWTTSR